MAEIYEVTVTALKNASRDHDKRSPELTYNEYKVIASDEDEAREMAKRCFWRNHNVGVYESYISG